MIGNEESVTSFLFLRTSIYCILLNHRTFHFHSLAGCCTSCAVRVKSGQLRQPEALGISAELKSKGYALLCVGFPSSDLEVETQDEDEVYWLQFGRYFARGPIERDDYALELAMADE
ncbi:ferredoxin C 2, chloroplastic isoform X2 [Jatropha curcas]|uniref:ferredoxin C 2, chloroplastic isoform X2 n=1 Tax=Jatropha curcas TaxID=180498 RepID=UPI0005FB9902|nr:ferredoxin C 2, chloroplastic isoform X2 [Jatropha curcas]